MKRVINFSGGRTSALMTILLKPTEDDLVIFCDTGREHPNTYKFINDFEAFEGIKIHRISYEHKKSPGLTGFDALNNHKTTLPNRTKRFCTVELKISTGKRYVRKLGVQQFECFVGFRADEKDRVQKYLKANNFKKVHPKFPLNDLDITSEMVNDYWLTKPYTLDLPRILGNCDLCFLKGKAAIIKILSVYPELADKWIADEKGMDEKGRPLARYFPDVTYEQLLEMAKKITPSESDLKLLTPAYSCSCTA